MIIWEMGDLGVTGHPQMCLTLLLCSYRYRSSRDRIWAHLDGIWLEIG